MVADIMRYYTGTKISQLSRFHEISNSNLNISWLQFSWDITLCSQYLIVDDFMRYYNRTKISHVCRFHEIFHRNLNISWLHISRLRFRLAHHRTALRYFLYLGVPPSAGKDDISEDSQTIFFLLVSSVIFSHHSEQM